MPWSWPVLIWSGLMAAAGLAVAVSSILRRRRCKSKGARAKLLEEAATTGTSATILALLQLLPDYLSRPRDHDDDTTSQTEWAVAPTDREAPDA
jgi:formate-dependent nitrite reductase membrane component NrfD